MILLKQLTNLQKIAQKELVLRNEGKRERGMDELKNNLLNRRIDEALLKSESDYENGRVRDAKEVFEEWKIKYGI